MSRTVFTVSFPEKQISEFDGNTLNAHAGFLLKKFWTGFDPRRRHEEKHVDSQKINVLFDLITHLVTRF